MVFKTLLILVVIAVLMEDSASIRKTEEERREEEEVAKAVNKTLAEEEKKRKEVENEKKTQEDEKEKKPDQGKKKNETQKKEDEKDPEKGKKKVDRSKVEDGENEACLPANCTDSCPTPVECEPCPECPSEKECPEVKRCGPCPGVKPCEPCLPCPGVNHTMEPPSTPGCPEPASMSVPEAMAVGAIASLLVTGVATAIGLLLRYTSPIFSGLLFIFIVVLTWYLSSHYPETARDLGGQVVATLREATIALGHRVMEAIRHHNDQVSFPNKPSLPKDEFHVSKRFALSFSM
jgi:uncharacterized membrane protein YphA (DoxX/SURF4 family)